MIFKGLPIVRNFVRPKSGPFETYFLEQCVLNFQRYIFKDVYYFRYVMHPSSIVLHRFEWPKLLFYNSIIITLSET